MSAIVNAAAHRLESSTGGVATQAANLSRPQPPVHDPMSPTELVDEVPTEFGGLTHLFGGGSLAEAAGQFLPVNTALTIPGGSIRGALGGLKPDFRNAAQKVQQAIATPPPIGPQGQGGYGQPAGVPRTFPGAVERARGWLKTNGLWPGGNVNRPGA